MRVSGKVEADAEGAAGARANGADDGFGGAATSGAVEHKLLTYTTVVHNGEFEVGVEGEG
jgi:hypothetical protein